MNQISLNKKKKVLIFVDWFYPGYKAGGPIQSCKNIVNTLQDDFDFYIFTSDRDIGDKMPYPGLKINEWTFYNEHIKIFYAATSFCTVKNYTKIIETVHPDTVYLNSMFSFLFTIKPLSAIRKVKNDLKVILAPRGMLHAGAIKNKKNKKLFFLAFLKYTGGLKNIIFHATDKQERLDIKKYLHARNRIVVLKNIPNVNASDIMPVIKNVNEARFIFISRIHPKKNILFFIESLAAFKQYNITFDIYGFVDDELYWQKCKNAITALPENIAVNYRGTLPNEKVFDTMGNYHVFALPTLGENFGHSIFESLSAGRPVLISDQTPWKNLATHKAGWDISLSKPKEYLAAIESIVRFNQQQFNEYAEGAKLYANNFIDLTALKQQYNKVFS